MTKRNCILMGVILAPILAFYGMLARETVNIPFLDDYSGVLGFISKWSLLGTGREKLMNILTSQHNEYKLIFADALYAFQYRIFGHINFAVLSIIGNSLLIPLFFLIYRMWTTDGRIIQQRVALFVPVSWVLCQLQYYSLLSWPVSTLQNIPVILFSLLTIYLLTRDRYGAFCISLISLSLAVSSSGNGFFVIPVGCIILLQFRRLARLTSWVAASAAILSVYLFKYNLHSSQAVPSRSVLSSFYHLSPIYALSFLGASVAKYDSYRLAAVVGILLCAIAVCAFVDRLYISNPALFYSICFIIITAIAVSGLRSDFGPAQSLVSRYRIYSNLLFILLYLYAIGRLFQTGRVPESNHARSIRWAAFSAMAVLAIGFNLASNRAGFKLLRARTQLTETGLCRWQRGAPPILPAPGPAVADPVIQRQQLNGIYTPDDHYLREAISLHTYSPPDFCRLGEPEF